jgi:hypothetical protein
LKFNEIENYLTVFWRISNINQNYYDDQLPTLKFRSLCEIDEVIEFVKKSDYILYQFFIEILMPDPLGNIQQNLVSSIRQLAKNLEAWSRNTNLPYKINISVQQTIQSFSMSLKRYTLLNHLIITVKNTLQNESVLKVMLNGLNKIDLNLIKVSFFNAFYEKAKFYYN